jgi:hypothetical protein
MPTVGDGEVTSTASDGVVMSTASNCEVTFTAGDGAVLIVTQKHLAGTSPRDVPVDMMIALHTTLP